jgi:hypothetical protein
MQINLQMLLRNAGADDNVFFSRLLNFDTQSVQSGNCDLGFSQSVQLRSMHVETYTADTVQS